MIHRNEWPLEGRPGAEYGLFEREHSLYAEDRREGVTPAQEALGTDTETRQSWRDETAEDNSRVPNLDAQTDGGVTGWERLVQRKTKYFDISGQETGFVVVFADKRARLRYIVTQISFLAHQLHT